MDITKSPSLFKLSQEAQIIQELKNEIQEHFVGVNLQQLKFDVDLIQVICQAIEDAVAYKGIKKSNKLDLFMSVYREIVGQMPPQEEQQIIKIVNFVVDKLIIERGLLSKAIRFLCNCFLKSKK